MKEEKINLKCIRQIFRFFPDSIILVADDGSVEFPDEQGNFSLASYLSYHVQGDSLAEGPAPCTINSSPLSLPSTIAACAPVRTPRGISIEDKWPSKPPAVAAKECTEWTKSIEVNQVTNGELNPQIGFNVNCIQRKIQPLNPQNRIQRQFHSKTGSSIKPTNRIQRQFHSEMDSTIKPTNRIQRQFHSKTDSTIKHTNRI